MLIIEPRSSLMKLLDREIWLLVKIYRFSSAIRFQAGKHNIDADALCLPMSLLSILKPWQLLKKMMSNWIASAPLVLVTFALVRCVPRNPETVSPRGLLSTTFDALRNRVLPGVLQKYFNVISLVVPQQKLSTLGVPMHAISTIQKAQNEPIGKSQATDSRFKQIYS